MTDRSIRLFAIALHSVRPSYHPWYKEVLQLASYRMVNFCAVVGCGNRSDREKSLSFYRLPSVITHQGEKTKELSETRRDLWLTRIHRADLGPQKYLHTRICSVHFFSGNGQDAIDLCAYQALLYIHLGKPSPLYDTNNPDWAPSIHLGGAPEPSLAGVKERHERAVSRRNKRSWNDTCARLSKRTRTVSLIIT